MLNRFDNYITDYLHEYKEVTLEKIGTLKTSGSAHDQQAGSVVFVCDKKAATTPELISFIAERIAKSKYLIASDIESHFAQVREFINIGKSYEVPGVGFIKANKTGVYEYLPYSEVNKPAKINVQPVTDKRKKQSNRSAIQLITLLIVIAILGGLGWQAYQFFSKSKTVDATETVINNSDTLKNAAAVVQNANLSVDTNTLKLRQTSALSDSNSKLNIKYIFETTASLLRVQTRTAQLKSFGNDAGYDSFIHNNTKFYNLYIFKPTKISDTLTVKDSLAKFLQKDIQLKIVPGTS
ncbi:MAG: hypothetical protein ABJB05_05990 [Parafilimonas sp.]